MDQVLNPNVSLMYRWLREEELYHRFPRKTNEENIEIERKYFLKKT
jgi:hypothetical protein